jgi:ABC-type Fe3+/spermidine/putrescine transport system ATPase subunit
LLDEPLAALDRKLREEMRAELREIQRRVGITTIFVTHDQHEALGLSDRVAVMNRGRIEQLGRPRDVYERPATRFVADFVGASSVVEGLAVDGATLELGAGFRLAVRLPRLLTPGARVQLLIRPERIEVPGGGPEAVVAKVVSAVYLGDHSELRLELPGGLRVLATVRGETAFTPGESIPVRLPPDAFLEVA